MCPFHDRTAIHHDDKHPEFISSPLLRVTWTDYSSNSVHNLISTFTVSVGFILLHNTYFYSVNVVLKKVLGFSMWCTHTRILWICKINSLPWTKWPVLCSELKRYWLTGLRGTFHWAEVMGLQVNISSLKSVRAGNWVGGLCDFGNVHTVMAWWLGQCVCGSVACWSVPKVL